MCKLAKRRIAKFTKKKILQKGGTLAALLASVALEVLTKVLK